LVNEIIARLKEGSIKNVVLSSDSPGVPEPPYVVVQPEAGVISNTRQYRITVHYNQGMFDALNEYTMNEIDKLLPGYIDDKDGSRFKLYKSGYTDLTPKPDGKTIFMERIYYSPMLGVER